MRVLGIDPGFATVGFGVLDYDGYKFKPVEYGAVLTEPGVAFEKRLNAIAVDTKFIINRFKPDCMSIEKLFFTTNLKTGIDVAQARGVLLLSAAQADLPVYEYTPLQVKQGVVGYGKAQKIQVMEMVRVILKLSELPKPDDAADALAIAICHCHNTLTQQRTAALKS
ncbi:MAG: crossover junction endodeoxyribonuclease RuvC [Oscillospiraceae bacterium]|nr:crossover junction endodeoxyribonuclease RuvC [Oscillospiraceae bacterium]